METTARETARAFAGWIDETVKSAKEYHEAINENVVWPEEAIQLTDEDIEMFDGWFDDSNFRGFNGKPIEITGWIDEATELTEEQMEAVKQMVGPQFSFTLHTSGLMDFRKRMYAFRCKSGFYITWKFIWMEDNLLPESLWLHARFEFQKQWPGFEILRQKATDIFEIEN